MTCAREVSLDGFVRTTTKSLPSPPKDKEKIDRASDMIAEMTMDTVFGEQDRYSKPRTRVIQKDGIWMVERQRIGTLVSKEKDFKFVGAPQTMTKSFSLALPRIPWNFFLQIVSFFRHVSDTMRESETYACIYWDFQENRYVLEVPKHQASKGGVHYVRDLEKDADPRWLLAMEIHSHNTMSGYFSGTDTADEKSLRMYGVVGHVERPLPEWAMRVVSSSHGKEVPIHAWDAFDISKEEVVALDSLPIVEFPVEEWVSKIEDMVRIEREARSIREVKETWRTRVPRGFGRSWQGDLFDSDGWFDDSHSLRDLCDRFGDDAIRSWKRQGEISQFEKDYLWSSGFDADDVEQRVLLHHGRTWDPMDGSMSFRDLHEVSVFADNLSIAMDIDEVVQLVGRLAANGFKEEIVKAVRLFHQDPDAFGSPIFEIGEER